MKDAGIDHDQDIYVCFVDFEKAFNRVDWTKLLKVLKDIGVKWRDRRLIAALYMSQRVVERLKHRFTSTSVEGIGQGTKRGCSLSPISLSHVT